MLSRTNRFSSKDRYQERRIRGGTSFAFVFCKPLLIWKTVTQMFNGWVSRTSVWKGLKWSLRVKTWMHHCNPRGRWRGITISCSTSTWRNYKLWLPTGVRCPRPLYFGHMSQATVRTYHVSQTGRPTCLFTFTWMIHWPMIRGTEGQEARSLISHSPRIEIKEKAVWSEKNGEASEIRA